MAWCHRTPPLWTPSPQPLPCVSGRRDFPTCYHPTKPHLARQKLEYVIVLQHFYNISCVFLSLFSFQKIVFEHGSKIKTIQKVHWVMSLFSVPIHHFLPLTISYHWISAYLLFCLALYFMHIWVNILILLFLIWKFKLFFYISLFFFSFKNTL